MAKFDIANHNFKQEEIDELKRYRDKQRDGRLKIRFLALLMIADMVPIEKVAFFIGKSVQTLQSWGKQHLNKGIDSLNFFNYKPKKTYLNLSQIEQLVQWVKENNPAKTKQIGAYIITEFKVTYSVEAVRQLLRKQGLRMLRPKQQPANPPSEEKQLEFVAEYHALKSSSEPGTRFFFIDGMHLVHQNEPGYCWGDPKNPPINKTNTGRKRLNILGGYDPDNFSLTHLTGETNCNAERVIEFFEIMKKGCGSAPKIIMFSDNAKYFKAGIVQEWLKKNPQIQLVFLPTYAPNLNLIERFWKFTKNKLVKNTYYEKYKTFRAHTFRFLNHVGDYKKELETLMVEKFQIIVTN